MSHECGHGFDRLTYLSVNESHSTMNACSTQRILQLLLFFLFAGAAAVAPPSFPVSSSSRPRTAMSMAVSKISCTPFISFEEHSMYIAPIFSATARPCCCVTGVRPWVLRSSMQVLLLRRSDLRPQRMMGVVGQKWRTSGYHYDTSVESRNKWMLNNTPCQERSRESWGSRWRNRRKANPSLGMKEVSTGHIPPAQLYPKVPAQPSSQIACARHA